MQVFDPTLFDFHNAKVTLMQQGMQVVLQDIKVVASNSKLLP